MRLSTQWQLSTQFLPFSLRMDGGTIDGFTA